MTLLFALSNDNYSILLADRRISRDGVLVDDEFNKICVLFCDDARVAVAYSGPAVSPAGNTSYWLYESLVDIGKQSRSIHDILFKLMSRADAYVTTLKVPDRRLSILFSGFVYGNGAPQAAAYVLSNHDGARPGVAAFSVRVISPQDSAIVEVAGNTSAIPPRTHSLLRELLGSNLVPASVLRAAVKHVRRGASSAFAAGSIGKQCNSVIILAAAGSQVTTTYHSAAKTHRAYGPNIVFTGDLCLSGTELHSGATVAGGDIRKKDPCWCGSGKLYKYCHMKDYGSVAVRIPMFKQPLPTGYLVILEAGLPSGKVFNVSSGYANRAD